MMPDRRLAAGVLFTLLAAAIGVVAAPSLPEQVTTHWNAAGQPDGTQPRLLLVVGGPALVLSVVALFEVFPRIDPLAENITAFQDAYDLLAVLLAAFLTYVYAFTVAWNLGYQFDVGQALAPAFAVLYVAVGFLLERAEPNWFVGLRTPWTLSSETVWRETHDRAATLFKLTGVVALGGLVRPDYFVYFVAVPAAAIALFGTVYSYVVYRRLDGDGTPVGGR